MLACAGSHPALETAPQRGFPSGAGEVTGRAALEAPGARAVGRGGAASPLGVLCASGARGSSPSYSHAVNEEAA